MRSKFEFILGIGMLGRVIIICLYIGLYVYTHVYRQNLSDNHKESVGTF